MREAALRALLDAIIKAFLKALRVLIGTLPTQGSTRVPEGYVEALYGLTVRYRRLAWAAQVLYLQAEGAQHGLTHTWVPDPPKYSEEAIRTVLREIPGGLSRSSFPKLEATLTRHVETAARQTMFGSLKAPSEVPTPEIPDDKQLGKDLKGFPKEQAEDIKAHFKASADATDNWEKEDARRRNRREKRIREQINQVTARVNQALKDIDDEGITLPKAIARELRDRSPEAVASAEAAGIPTGRDTDRYGQRIARPFAYARVTHPGKNGPCGFCAMLASRGPIYKSEKSAIGSGYHDGDRCTCTPVFTSRDWEGKEASQEYAATYDDIVRQGGLSGADARTQLDYHFRGKDRNRHKEDK